MIYIHPGYVYSEYDGDLCYVSAERIAALYGVRRYRVLRDDGPDELQYRPHHGDIHLFPDS